MKTLLFLFLLPVFVFSQSISFDFENDVFAHSDHDYTNGVKIAYARPVDSSPLAFLLPLPATEENHSIFQWMYTPEKREEAANQPDDRPWAGHLGYQYSVAASKGKHYYTTGVQLGVVGPLAFAGETQAKVHEWVGSVNPRGWDNQVPNRLSVNLIYGYKYKPLASNWYDLILGSHAVAGTTLVSAGVDAQTRLGWNIPLDFGKQKNEPVPFFNVDVWSLYGIGRVESRAVAYNYTLEGAEVSNIDREWFVHEASLGVGAELKSFAVVYLFTWRTKEFDSDENIKPFGTVSIRWRF